MQTLFLFFLSFIPRLSYLAVEHGRISFFGNLYENISYNLLHRHAFIFGKTPTTGIDPLYPLFLAAARAMLPDTVWPAIILQIVVASAGGVLLYHLCLELGLGRKGAWIASVLYAWHPYLVRQSVLMSEVSVYAVLLITTAYCFVRCEKGGGRRAVLCGVAFGLLCLTRIMSTPILGLGVAALFFQKRSKEAVIVFVAAVLCVLPFSLRDYRLEGVCFPSRGGINLFEGNCEYTAAVVPKYSTDLLNPYAFKLLQKERPDVLSVEDTGDGLFYAKRRADAFFAEKALEYMRAHPWRTVKQKIRNAYYLFYPRLVPRFSVNDASELTLLPNGSVRSENTPPREALFEGVYSVYYGSLLVLAIAGLWFRRSQLFRRDLILIVIAATFAIVYSIYWPATRLRAPMDFVLIFYAACALSRLTGTRKPA